MGIFIEELFKTNLYKRSQGKIVRQATAFALYAILFVLVCLIGIWLGTYTWPEFISPQTGVALNYLIPVVLAAVFGWCCFRLVQVPRFADFLIHVEAEMRKVSWPGKQELILSTTVVIIVMFSMAGLLFGYDMLIRQIFYWIGVGGQKLFIAMGIFK